MYTDYGDMPSTLNHPFFESITPIPSSYVLDETNIIASGAPVSEPGGAFERNEHVIRFATNGETANGQATGHKYQRRQAFDIAFDMKIETPHPNVRKEAGLYFKSPLGNALLYAGTNSGSHYSATYPGEITTVFSGVIPEYSFSGSGGPLGDYNHNGTVDAADFTIWRDTLGSTTDFRANGNNEGASADLIDQADYDVWKSAFGQGTSGGSIGYTAGDTLRMRAIYTPPELYDTNLPDIANDPNVKTPGKIEYIMSLNGAAPISSGELVFDNSWQGIPNDTLIMLRVQNLSTASASPDSAKTTFSNFDFNGNLPGSGAGSGLGSLASVPEPSAMLLIGIGLSMMGLVRRR